MYFVQKGRHKIVLQISYLMLLFLLLSSVANFMQGRYSFVVVYIFGAMATLTHLVWYHRKGDIKHAGERILVLLWVIFFAFFIIGEHATFDVLWVLILPIVAVILESYEATKRWLFAFVALLGASIALQAFFPHIIRYESFALWSLLWAGIFLSGMALYYKKTQNLLERELAVYQDNLEQKVMRSVHEIESLREQEAQTRLSLMQSRLMSLETQLNPHFLFNALNSIAELLHQDAHKAEEAILKVSTFLRNTMSEQTSIALSLELEYVRDYVELENLRFGDTITLVMPELIPSWKVPKFSIQLLVENAIKHGKQGKGLNISIIIDEPNSSITVQNDGKSMPSCTLGIGLKNLMQRLKLLCDGHMEVTTGEKPAFMLYLGEGCRATTST